MSQSDTRHDAWNPGLDSELPARLKPRATLYAPGNATLSYAEASEAARFCGRKPQEMAAFTVSRLAVHEVLIRVTADLFVPDGPAYEELGLNLRSMTACILDGHVAPELERLERDFEALSARAEGIIAAHLDEAVAPAPAPEPQGGFSLSRLFGRGRDRAPAAGAGGRGPAGEGAEFAALARWRAACDAPADAEAATPDSDAALERACLEALVFAVGGILGQHGRLAGGREMAQRLALGQLRNTHGSAVLGAWIDPILRKAATAEGFRLLPHQQAPFVMNVKGASAAGKSTIRPLQRELAERIGVPWEDFALVSPDYWRKFLLDYDSLGEDYKYAAMLTGQELEIIDRKLDRYMAAKATRNEMPHLLIDRFRFDSFASPVTQQGDGQLLSRFGATVFMFFVITPPVDTVERAWARGKATGRYKAVDDLLFHNVEAYTGMPQLFFTWVNKEQQKVHFEFLDNSVPHGQRPRTAAFGWNGELTILDHDCMRRLMRYREINVEAKRPEEVQRAPGAGAQAGGDILADCVARIPRVTFADPGDGRILAQTRDGAVIAAQPGFLDEIGLADLAGASTAPAPEPDEAIDAAGQKPFTVGNWGRDKSTAQSPVDISRAAT